MNSKKTLVMVESGTITQLDKNRVVEWEHAYPLETRNAGEFKQKAVYLPDKYEWVIGYDSHGTTILVALDR